MTGSTIREDHIDDSNIVLKYQLIPTLLEIKHVENADRQTDRTTEPQTTTSTDNKGRYKARERKTVTRYAISL